MKREEREREGGRAKISLYVCCRLVANKFERVCMSEETHLIVLCSYSLGTCEFGVLETCHGSRNLILEVWNPVYSLVVTCHTLVLKGDLEFTDYNER